MPLSSSLHPLPFHLQKVTTSAHLLRHPAPRLLPLDHHLLPDQHLRLSPMGTMASTPCACAAAFMHLVAFNPPLACQPSLTPCFLGDIGYVAAVSVEYEVVQESPVLVPLPVLSSSIDAAFSKLDVGANADPQSFSAILQYPPSETFDLEGVRSREAHRLNAVEEDRCCVQCASLTRKLN